MSDNFIKEEERQRQIKHEITAKSKAEWIVLKAGKYII